MTIKQVEKLNSMNPKMLCTIWNFQAKTLAGKDIEIEIVKKIVANYKRLPDPCHGQATFSDGTSDFLYPSKIKFLVDGQLYKTYSWGINVVAGRYHAHISYDRKNIYIGKEIQKQNGSTHL